jgi:UDP-N-acetylmuramate: L-alanyl-gamma-D-glutamyl-meso-diaminopimelate ligase
MAEWTFYGEESKLGPDIIESVPEGTVFKIFTDQEYIFSTNLTGYHNILNLTAVILLALKDGFSSEQINAVIKDLKMVKRRQEFRGYYKKSIVIDDFAHHPRAVAMTIDSIQQTYPDRKIITFMEPRSATARSNIFQQEYAEALRKSAKVVLLQPNPTTVKFAQDLDTTLLAQDLEKNNIFAKIVSDLTGLQEQIDAHAGPENLLLFLSNSTCLGLWKSDFVKNLRN